MDTKLRPMYAKTMKYIGIDYGTKNVGIAVSDENETVAFPKYILPNDAQLLRAVKRIIQDERIRGVVMGHSVDFSGSDNVVMSAARAFAEKITDETALPMYYENEAFTTQQASRQGTEGVARGIIANTKKKVLSSHNDASAAALILQSFLDKRAIQ